MLSKGKINIILGLCLTSIVSIGFSSWVMGLEGSEVVGNIEVDNIINSNKYVMLDKANLQIFSYSDTGFKGDNSEIGQIIAPYTIHIGQCRNDLGYEQFNEFNIELSLKYASTFTSDINLFYDSEQEHTLTHSLTTLTNETKIQSTINDYNYTIEIPITDDGTTNDISFTITYTFWVDSNYYVNNVLSMFNNENFNFSLNTKLTLN